MGCEFGQRREWTHEDSLEWHVLGADPRHEGVQRWVADLNRVYCNEKALHEKDFSVDGFRWVQRGDWEQSAIAYLRQSPSGPPMLVVCNFTPVPRYNYRVGVPRGGRWRELLNSDAAYYGGSGMGNQGGADAQPMPYEELSHSLTLTLPPLAVLFFKPE
jgi:1,4-alpha-glucan branching enzyme